MRSALAKASLASLALHGLAVGASSSSHALLIRVERGPASAPIAVTFVDVHDPPVGDDAEPSAAPSRAAVEPRVASRLTARSRDGTERPLATESNPSGTRLLAMRGVGKRPPDLTDLGRFAGRLKGSGPPDTGKAASLLDPAGGGRYRNERGTFTVHTEGDGAVRFEDKPNLRIRFNLPDKKFIAGVLRSWQADPYKHATGQSEVELPNDKIVSGGFDVTDALMRRLGDDPYITQKLDFLDQTRSERTAIAGRARTERLADTARSTRRLVKRIANRADLSAAEKRRLLFDLWDECAEDGSAEVIEASRAARATITGFIRKEFPAPSADAYTAAELDALNGARTSSERFEPYPNAL